MAFQQQIQSLKTQHDEFVTSLKQSQSAAVPQLAAAAAEAEKALPMATPAGENAAAPLTPASAFWLKHKPAYLSLSSPPVLVLSTGDIKPPMSGPPPGDFDGSLSRPQDPGNSSGPSDIPPNKSAWYDHQQVGPWNPNQPVKTRSFHCPHLEHKQASRSFDVMDTLTFGSSPAFL